MKPINHKRLGRVNFSLLKKKPAEAGSSCPDRDVQNLGGPEHVGY